MKEILLLLVQKKQFQLIRMVCFCGDLSWGFGVVRKALTNIKALKYLEKTTMSATLY